MEAELPAGIDPLLNELYLQLGITSRRLERSGPAHFARSRFDALMFLARNGFDEIYAAPESVLTAERVKSLRYALLKLLQTYPELDAVSHPRNERSTHRAEMLIDEILETVGERRRGRLVNAPLYDYSPFSDRIDTEITDAAEATRPEEMEVLRLSGKF